MAWNLDSDHPIYIQLMEVLQTRIVSGFYAPGQRLPSVRELAAEAGVNPNTMQKAFSELEWSGLILTQRTSGRLVTENTALIADTRLSLAQRQIGQFCAGMKELGYQPQEAADLIRRAAEEGKV